MAGPDGNCQTLFIQRQLSDAEHFMHAFTKNMGFIGFYSKWNTKSLKFGGWFGTKPKSCKMPKP